MPKIHGHTRWTDDEVELLKRLYGSFKANNPPAELKHRSSKAIRSKASQLGLQCNLGSGSFVRRTYSCNDFYFEVPNAVNSYWAGFIAADGCVDDHNRLRIILSSKDYEHLKKFKSDLMYTGPIHRYENKTGYKLAEMCRLEVCCSNQIIVDLKNNFCIVPQKTYTLCPPVGLSNLNSFSYLLGLIDGDGCLYSTKGRFVIELLGTEKVMKFAKRVFSFLLNKNVNSTIRSVRGTYNLRISGKKAVQLKHMALSLKLPLLERKWGTL